MALPVALPVAHREGLARGAPFLAVQAHVHVRRAAGRVGPVLLAHLALGAPPELPGAWGPMRALDELLPLPQPRHRAIHH